MVIDVRKEGEYTDEHIEDAYREPLTYINDWVNVLDNNQHFYLPFERRNKRIIAPSSIKTRGYTNFTEV